MTVNCQSVKEGEGKGMNVSTLRECVLQEKQTGEERGEGDGGELPSVGGKGEKRGENGRSFQKGRVTHQSLV